MRTRLSNVWAYQFSCHWRPSRRVNGEYAGSHVPCWAAALLACASLWPIVAVAQPTSNSITPVDIMIAPDMPGATPAAQPGPDTPVPSWAQQSYKAYLQMKAKVHGGTRYTRKTYWQMPDWSGVWNHVDGYAWDHNVDQNAKRDTEPFIKKIFEHCSSFPCEGWVTATLTPKYALRYREKLAAGVHGVQSEPLSQCLPGGFPRDILVTAAAYKFLPTPNETIMYWQEDQGDRFIHTDGRGHIPKMRPFHSGSATQSGSGTVTRSSRTRSICVAWS